MTNMSETRLLEILVAKARGWTVEPYVAVIEIPGYNRPVRGEEYDRFRLRDGMGVVRADWAFTEESAWDMVPQWATISAHRDELEDHIVQRFGALQVHMNRDEDDYHPKAGCVIRVNSDKTLSAYVGSGDTKGIAVCRAYLNAVEAEADRVTSVKQEGDRKTMTETEPKIGDKYRHYKGAVYTVLCVAKDADTTLDMIVYQGEDGRVWTRLSITSSRMSGSSRGTLPRVGQWCLALSGSR